jgi:hypothetical protein
MGFIVIGLTGEGTVGKRELRVDNGYSGAGRLYELIMLIF